MDKQMLNNYPDYNLNDLDRIYQTEINQFNHKIIVLDDDPTGTQTIHDLHVYTNWDEDSILDGFKSDQKMFFILTNSRSFSQRKTRDVHKMIVERIDKIAEKLNQRYILISRGDSTLRGHYPLETETLNKHSNIKADGEILIPFFLEGGRYTINDTHYVEINDELVPAGQTQFAQDRTFGFQSSHLGEYIEEKTNGRYTKKSVSTIDLADLRSLDIDKIEKQLMNVNNFNKVVVNAVSEDDLRIFVIALFRAINSGKTFIFRTAASFTKVIGNVPSRSLLSKEELTQSENHSGGLIIVGSHVRKTTEQLNELVKLPFVKPIEFNSDLVVDDRKFEEEIHNRIKKLDQHISSGKTCVIYTKRKRLDLGEDQAEKELELSVKISNGLTKIIHELTSKPRYIIAKGGITSSDIGTNALGVTKALVKGQALPGIPVWQTDEQSKYPNIPYIIFPGNVGKVTDLYEIVNRIE